MKEITATEIAFPRDEEMGNGAMRLGFTHVPRAYGAALIEHAYRGGEVTEEQWVAMEAELIALNPRGAVDRARQEALVEVLSWAGRL